MGRIEPAIALLLLLTPIACSPAAQSRDVATIAIAPEPAVSSTSSPSPRSRRTEAAAKAEAPRSIIWEVSEQDAKAKARREGRPMIVYLCASWSVASLHADRGVWTDMRVTNEARAFVALKIDLTEGSEASDLLADRWGAHAVPTIVLLDASGSRVAALSGEIDVNALLEAMRRASE